MKKYKVWFSNFNDDDIENADEYSTKWGADDAAEEFLKFQYHECDGCEWMPKDYGKTKIIVMDLETGEKEEFTWELDYEPSFYVYS